MLRDPETFTVDDPRFSTGRVLGPSMLSLDGSEHRRHRSPFTALFIRGWVDELAGTIVAAEAERAVGRIAARGRAELRTELAGPFVATVIGRALGLAAPADDVLGWYRAIVEAVTDTDAGRPVAGSATEAIDHLRDIVAAAQSSTDGPLAGPAAVLDGDEVFANVAVTLFGAIETTEGMIANALYHLLTDPVRLAYARRDHGALQRSIDESLRLEPAAAIVDRYTSRPVRLGPASISAGELVSVSIRDANRDPGHLDDPDRFDPDRSDAGAHLAFATGPHSCIGAQLARAETAALLDALFERCADIELVADATDRPTGFIFRKPNRITARWTAAQRPR